MADPLQSLPDIHALLDVVESMIMEGMEKEDREKFVFQMYRPEPNEVPKNFDEDDQMDAFAAFESATAGLK